MPYKEALRANMDRVIAADAQNLWHQGDWVAPVDEDGERVSNRLAAELGGEYCRTAGCFAGHYVFSRGYTEVDWCCSKVTNPATGIVLSFDHDNVDSVDNVSGYTRYGLGLSESQANKLFDGANTLHQLKDMVDEICGTLE
jgi:hypothetical protein